MPETVDKCKKLALPGQGDAFAEQMLDVHGQRLDIMTENNVEMFVLSLASPGPQGEHDREKAEVSAPTQRDEPRLTVGIMTGACPPSE